MIDGLRPDSLYANAYYRLRQPLIDLMFEGVRWDSESAEKVRQQLEERKKEIKVQLDQLTGGVRLYPVHRHRSKVLTELLAQQRSIKDAAKGLGRTEKGQKLRSELKSLQLQIKELRTSGGGVELEVGDGLSGKSIAEYLYGEKSPKEPGIMPGLGLPARKKRRKESGKSTVTVDDTALQKILLAFGQRRLDNHTRGTVGDLIGLLREHRRAEKLVSTYLNPEKMLSPVDGRFHSVYKTHGTQTGRLSSSSDPWDYGGNAQNQDREYKFLFLPDD